MRFSQLVDSYGHLLQAGTLLKTLGDQSVKRVVLQGLVGSSVSVLFSSVFDRIGRTILFILDDADEAGYFFNDLSVSRAYYFPSAYRRG